MRREWLLRLLLLIVAPTIFFALVEMGLRLFGYGYPTDFFIKNPVAGTKSLVENRQFSRRYFPSQLARAPHSLAFLPVKPPRTLRIFVFGESAAEGDPAPAFGFARILQVMLRERYPALNVEVINTAVTAINSHSIHPIAHEAAAYSGDVWVIYMGNNEVVGPFGSGSIFGAPTARLSLIRASIALKATRFGQFLDRALGSLSPNSGPHDWEGMEMFLKRQVRQNDPCMSAVYGHFEKNLSDITSFGVRSGAKVIVSTVGSNLRDCPPFASLHPADFPDSKKAEWDKLYDAGIALERVGKFADAVAEFQRAAAVDDQFAELNFRLARCYAALGRLDEARRHFALARDLDTLRFRADSRLNETTRRVVQEWQGRNVRLVDVEQALTREAGDGIPGSESFYEHVHLTFAGNYVVAKELAAQISQMLTDDPSASGGSAARTNLLSLDECARRLAFTDSDRLQIALEMARRTGRPPFTQQLDHEARRSYWKPVLAGLYEQDRTNLLESITTYQGAIQRDASDWELRDNFAAALVQHGDRTNALAQWQRAAQILPHRLQTYDMIGNIHLEAGRLGEAAACYREALSIDPDFLQGRIGLGRVLLAQNAGAAAIQQFRRAVKLQPRWAWPHDLLGQALMQLGEAAEAEEAFRAALAVQPDFSSARLNLAGAMLKQGDPATALAELHEVLRLDPQNARARQLLNAAEGKRP